MARTISVKFQLIPVIVLMAVCLVIFFNTFANELVWDDTRLITKNLHIRDHKNIPLFFTPRYWKKVHFFQDQYRPLRTASFAMDYYFWELNPVGYHVTNLVLHTLNVVLIFYLVSLLAGKAPGGRPDEITGKKVFLALPFLTALFFAAHPMHTESINLIKNRSDLMAFLFCLLSFLLFIKNSAAGGRMAGRLWAIGAWFCFIAAILSKEMALSLPGVLVLYAACFLSGSQRKAAVIRIVPYGVIIFIYFWFMQTFISLGEALPAGVTRPENTVQEILTVIKTLGYYLKMLSIPFPLNADRAFDVPTSLMMPSVLFSLIALLMVLSLAVGTYKRSPIIFFSLGWIVLTLLPAANIVYLISRPIAEQRLYIPSFGFCLLLACGIQRLSRVNSGPLNRGRAFLLSGLLAVLIAGLYSVMTVNRNADWRDAITFYSRSVAANPDSARMHNNLGQALSAAGRYEEAVSHYIWALLLEPNYVAAHINYGSLLSDLNRSEEAIKHYQRALCLKPEHSAAHNNLGNLMLERGETEKAIHHFSQAVRFDPGNALYLHHLGIALVDSGRAQEGVSHYLTALRIEPHNPGLHNSLGIALGDLGRFEEAVQEFLIAIQLTPNNIQVLNNLGIAMVGTGRVEDAIRRLPADLLLSPDFGWVYNSMGNVSMRQGRFDQARQYFHQALKLMPDNGAIYYNLGTVAAAEGNYRQAANFFANALKFIPDSAATRQQYRECLQMMKESDLTASGGQGTNEAEK